LKQLDAQEVVNLELCFPVFEFQMMFKATFVLFSFFLSWMVQKQSWRYRVTISSAKLELLSQYINTLLATPTSPCFAE